MTLWKPGQEDDVIDSVIKLYVPELVSTMLNGGTAAEEVISKALFDVADIEIAAAAVARGSAGTLIRDINARKLTSVQRITAKAISEGWTDAETADAIELKVGLSPRDQQAVDNYRESLIKGGWNKGAARKEAKGYGDRLRRTRAETIAKTEIMRAINEGRRSVWKGAVAAGTVTPFVHRQWVVHRDERLCKVCRPLGGRIAKLDGPYPGLSVEPPAHPNCRCYEQLVDVRGTVIKHTTRSTVEKVRSAPCAICGRKMTDPDSIRRGFGGSHLVSRSPRVQARVRAQRAANARRTGDPDVAFTGAWIASQQRAKKKAPTVKKKATRKATAATLSVEQGRARGWWPYEDFDRPVQTNLRLYNRGQISRTELNSRHSLFSDMPPDEFRWTISTIEAGSADQAAGRGRSGPAPMTTAKKKAMRTELRRRERQRSEERALGQLGFKKKAKKKATPIRPNPLASREWDDLDDDDDDYAGLEELKPLFKPGPGRGSAWSEKPATRETMKKVKEVWESTFEHGFSTEVKRAIVRYNSELMVKGVIKKDGRKVGEFTRTMKSDGEVHHDLMTINKNAQGAGFSRQFNERAFFQYKQLGFTHVTVQANIDIGGYAWTKQGFNWDTRNWAVGDVPRRLQSAIDEAKELDDDDPRKPTPATLAKAEAMMKAFRNHGVNHPQHPKTTDIATLGIDKTWEGTGNPRTRDWKVPRGMMTWFGKDVLVGSDWEGRRDL